ncbi:hypothetical protein KC19_12G028100 [Ceratodon purpureus]|uniref:Uncharacterized protein n=2 Tax=Ceratodon purpureus TaxID=3225 RepID=A0A8T0G8P7_CERPU|nr:hypothetical protein KC19_12G028100 [Ceratodon purpureus]
MSQYETTTITPGEQQTGLTTEESYDNIDPNSPNYQGSEKKSGILGKLKDKTKKAGSKIKSKVGKKKNTDGTPTTPTGAVGEEEDDEEDGSDDLSSPAVQTTPYTGPASVPREFGTYPSQGKSGSQETDSTPPDMSGLSLNDSSTPSATDKASEMSQGAKDAMYGGAAATAGAVGVGAMSNDDDNDEKPVTEKASDASSDAAGKAEEFGRGGYNRAGETKDAVAEKGSEAVDQTKDTAYGTKDAAQSKAADLNNATDDSETYTEKASNTATAAKDTVADKLGMNQSSQGPSVMDQAKGYFGSAVDTTKEKTGMNQPSQGPSVVDQAKGYFGSAVDTTKEKTGMNQPSQGPSLMDQAKGYFGSTVDTTKDKTGTGVDTTKDYAAGAKDTTMDTTGSAADTTKDYASSAYDNTANAAQGATDTTKDYASSAYDKTADAAQGTTDTTKDYATRAKDTVADATTPKDEHKALSEKITDSLSGLTAPANTPTGAAHDETNPGILGKLTGMLGYPQKAPESHPHDAGVTPSDTTTTTATQ